MQAEQSRRELASRLREQWSAERNDASAELAEVDQSLVRTQARLEGLELRSPVHGLINGLVINTLNEVINPGQVVMSSADEANVGAH